jgi:hypothetical protein
MNKIVREHYPVANLPADLREGLGEGVTARVMVEIEEAAVPEKTVGDFGSSGFETRDHKAMTIEELRAAFKRVRAEDRPSVSVDEAVTRIRELRDEWDD